MKPIRVDGFSAPLMPTGEPAPAWPDELLLTRAEQDLVGPHGSRTNRRLARSAFILGWRVALALDRARRPLTTETAR